MEHWIRSHFSIIPDGWTGLSGQREDAFVFGAVQAPVSWLVSAFGPETPASAASLKAMDPNDRLGWHKHFDAWAAQGILSME